MAWKVAGAFISPNGMAQNWKRRPTSGGLLPLLPRHRRHIRYQSSGVLGNFAWSSCSCPPNSGSLRVPPWRGAIVAAGIADGLSSASSDARHMNSPFLKMRNSQASAFGDGRLLTPLAVVPDSGMCLGVTAKEFLQAGCQSGRNGSRPRVLQLVNCGPGLCLGVTAKEFLQAGCQSGRNGSRPRVLQLVNCGPGLERFWLTGVPAPVFVHSFVCVLAVRWSSGMGRRGKREPSEGTEEGEVAGTPQDVVSSGDSRGIKLPGRPLARHHSTADQLTRTHRRMFLKVAVLTLALCVLATAEEDKSQKKRGIFGESLGSGLGLGYSSGLGYGSGLGLGYGSSLGYSSGLGYGSSLGYGSGLGYGSSLGYGSGLGLGYGYGAGVGLAGPVQESVTITRKVPVGVPQPYPVHVQNDVPYPVPHPVAVPVSRPYPVKVAQPVAVPVDRPYPVPVDKPVAVPVPHSVPYPVPHPVAVPVSKPYPVAVPKPYAVPVAQPVVVAKAAPVIAAIGGGYGASYGAGIASYGAGISSYGAGISSYGAGISSYGHSIASLGHSAW
ncbi:uncharacterized protein LOC134535347 [Bacillus rossius redtenbacheri]|uniref:uncharacterized protein LOC134535347 n=1 Tax=Bacillus rossius redtenbacheri TaxID=93214 RepID=UPI002FDEEFD9